MEAFCFAGTAFAPDGSFDETAMEAVLQRFVEAGVGVYLASGGGGEGHALSNDELARLYAVGVRVCKGRIPVHANPPERHTAARAREQVLIARNAGIEAVHLYHLAGWHGMKPTDPELNAYFDDVLDGVDCPITVAVNATMGYLPSAALIAGVCNRHRQVAAVKLTGTAPSYLIDLKRLIDREVGFHLNVSTALSALGIGTTAVFGSEANVIPDTFRAFVDVFARGNADEIGAALPALLGFDQYVRKWNPSNPRWIKMAWHVLRLPGGAGGPRMPYLLPGEDELDRFAQGLRTLDIPELSALADAAGIPG
jgi:dihydrodipicolinate synthase/N-acetylneuraminate lyase